MHIPDGFLDTKTWVTLSIASAGAVSLAVNKTKGIADGKYIPLMGIMSAFVFAAQMINFPVAGGTSGHFMGGVLASVLLGPLTGILIMTTLLAVQCLIFQDGGLTALGANIFNMGVIGCLSGYLVYKILNKVFSHLIKIKNSWMVSAGVAAWFSIVASSIACAVELAVSGTAPIKIVLPAMAGIHCIIGIGEAVITVLILKFIMKVRPDLFELKKI